MFTTKFHPNPMTLVRVTSNFRLKEHLYTFELPPKRDPPPIELIFTGLNLHTLAIYPTNFDPNPTQCIQVTLVFMLTPKA